MKKEKPAIIQYVRKEDKRPIGVVVATDRDKIGIALCSPKDEWNKEIGIQIAVGRAEKVPCETQLDNLIPYNQEKGIELVYTFNSVKKRAEKYYK